MFSHYISPALLATILAAIIVAVLLFVPPINGLADTGDFYRAILSNGIYRLPNDTSNFVDYVQLKFGIYQYYNENGMIAFSSQSLFIQIALLFNKLFYSSKIFDLRFLGAVYYVLYLGAIYLLTKSLVFPYRRVRSYLIALLVVFIFADSTFTLYFNSFYAEPVMFIGLLYAFASIMLLARHAYQKNWPMALIFFASVMLLITAKSQNAPLALTFIVVAIGFFFLPKFHARRWAVGLGMVFVLFSGVVTYKAITTEFVDVNQYKAFTHGVLLENGDPSDKIARAGIDQQYALLRNENYYPRTYTSVKATNKLIQKHLLKKNGIGWTIKYYLFNPKQFLQLMDVATRDLMITEVRAVGDYPQKTGHKAGEKTNYFSLYSNYMATFFPGKYAFTCLMAIFFIGVYGVSFYLDLRSGRYEGVMRLFLVFGMCTIFIFVPVVSIIGDGDADLAKHIFMGPVAWDLIFVLFISDILHHRLWNTEVERDD